MAASRRPDPGRRAAARSSSRPSVRRAATPPRRTTPAAAEPRPPSTGLTTRAAVLGLVLCALVVSAALPLRGYLSQRSEIGKLEQAQSEQRERVEALEALRGRLEDPAYLAAEARRRLHYVMPGETAYVLLAPDELALTDPEATVNGLPVDPDSPWYSQIWDTVEAADRPDEAGVLDPDVLDPDLQPGAGAR